jgi:hypothetical protein
LKTCTLCNNEVAAVGLCGRCQHRIHQNLDDLIEFWSLAHEELLPGKSGGGGRSSERTLGLNVAALSFIAGDDILKTLHEWEKLIRSHRAFTPPALLSKTENLESEIRAAVAFAQANLPWSGSQPWIGDFANEVKALHSQGMAAARVFVKKTRRIACPAEVGDGICNNLLKINEDDPLDIFECRLCHSQWSTLRLVAVAMADPSRQVWLDAEAISTWLGLSERHIRRVAKANHIARKGELWDANSLRRLLAI